MPQTFTYVTPAHRRELEQLITIYQAAIDPSEQKSAAEIAAMLDDPRYAFIASATGGTVTGFSICFFPANADFWLLEYMAVDASARSGGLGEAIFAESYHHGLTRVPGGTMLLEVDQPGQSRNSANDTEARVRFYRRMGCRMVMGLNYILPMDASGTPPPMMLLTYAIPSLNVVSKAHAQNWLTSLYTDVYAKAKDDPRIPLMLSHLPDTLVVVPF